MTTPSLVAKSSLTLHHFSHKVEVSSPTAMALVLMTCKLKFTIELKNLTNMTLNQCVENFISNITPTDYQENSIDASFNHLKDILEDDDCPLNFTEVFLNGSYYRRTIIRPIDDIDVFAVFEPETSEPSPQSILTSLKKYLDKPGKYEGKCKQDRPCITIELTGKHIDVMPAIKEDDHYVIPNVDLSGWMRTRPKKLSSELNDANRNNGYKLKKVVMAVKSWKRKKDLPLPSFHVEEIAIKIFADNNLENYRCGIIKWFNHAQSYLNEHRFRTESKYQQVKTAIQAVKEKLNEAEKCMNDHEEPTAKKIWKEIFGSDFCIIDVEEARSYSQNLSEGNLKYSLAGGLSTIAGSAIAASKGFYGEDTSTTNK